MSFPQHHWDNPRETIAVKYKDNDYGYTMHGAKVCADVLLRINLPPRTLRNMTIIDYGCGTGRMATILAYHSKHVVGYDINEACIEMAKADLKKVDYDTNNVEFTTTVPSEPVDFVFAVSVLEHLDEASFKVAMQNITRLTKVGAVLYFSTSKNPSMKYFYPGFGAQDNAILIVYLTADELQAGLARYK